MTIKPKLKMTPFRLSRADIAALDHLAAAETKKRNDGSRVSRADVIRRLIREAIKK